MTQIANLQQIDGARTSFTISKGAVLQYSIAFPAQAGTQIPLVAAATMAAGSAVLSNLPTATVSSLVTGQPVAGYGIPAGTTVVGIYSATSVNLSASATQSSAAAGVTFRPIPLDLTGISFRQQIRASAGGGAMYLEMSTDNGLLISGGASGVLAALVPPGQLTPLPLAPSTAPLVTDIVATASDGGPVNLMALSGPASVTVLQTVTA